MARGKKKLTKTINYSNINKLMNHSIEAKYKNKMNQNIQIQDLIAYKKKKKKKRPFDNDVWSGELTGRVGCVVIAIAKRPETRKKVENLTMTLGLEY
jgi:high-affinity Fe2+/Pb2+ permease